MADYTQLKKFSFAKMGNKAGYCLQNVRKGYGLASKFASAKADMESNKKKKALHSGLDTIPKGVQVPLYWDVTSPYEHINVSAGDGKYMYNDGKKIKLWKTVKFFGWGEYCEGTQVVKKSSEIKTYVVVKKGDTLSAIAKKYKTTVVKLMKLNPTIKNANVISVGQKVRVK